MKRPRRTPDTADAPQSESKPTQVRLSPREETIADFVAEGCTAKEIGRALRISPETARNHIRNIARKLPFDTYGRPWRSVLVWRVHSDTNR